MLRGELGSSHIWKDQVLKGGRLKSGGQSASASALPFSKMQVCCFHCVCQITDMSVALYYSSTVALDAEDELFPGKSTGNSVMWLLKPSQLRGRQLRPNGVNSG